MFSYKLGRRKIYFTNHALDRWWERCNKNKGLGRNESVSLLSEVLGKGRWTTEMPAWSRLSLWNRSIAEGFIYVDQDSGFVINRNRVSRDRVAVTYIENIEVNPDSYKRFSK